MAFIADIKVSLYFSQVDVTVPREALSVVCHSVHPPSFCWDVEPITKFSKGGGGGVVLTGPQL